MTKLTPEQIADFPSDVMDLYRRVADANPELNIEDVYADWNDAHDEKLLVVAARIYFIAEFRDERYRHIGKQGFDTIFIVLVRKMMDYGEALEQAEIEAEETA